MGVYIYKLDSDNDLVTVLHTGEHVFGRGDLLKCNDKRISRTHGLISVKNGSATITGTHQNPCFYQAANSSMITILPKDTPVFIEDGDKFALLPDQFWFRMKLKHEQDNTVNNESQNLCDNASQLSGTLSTSGTCNIKTEENAVYSATNDMLSNGTNVEFIDFKIKEEEPNGLHTAVDISEEDIKKEIKEEPTSSHNAHRTSEDPAHEAALRAALFSSDEDCEENYVKPDVPPDKKPDIKPFQNLNNINPDATCTSTNSITNQPGTSNGRQRRDRCFYGASCYRKNQAHLSEFSHPNDSDYDSDANDNRPMCPYGADCYRRNKVHRRSYKHPGNAKPCPKRTKDKRNTKKRTPSGNNDESSENEYDMEDPFMAGSSSEFEFDSVSEDDTNEEWSEVEEETKRLVKEAKRFTKRKK